MSTETISNIRIYPTKLEGTTLANGKVTLFGVLDVSFRVMKSNGGLWIGYPGHLSAEADENGKKQWYHDFYVSDETLREEMSQAILSSFEESKSRKPTAASPKGFPTPGKPNSKANRTF